MLTYIDANLSIDLENLGSIVKIETGYTEDEYLAYTKQDRPHLLTKDQYEIIRAKIQPKEFPPPSFYEGAQRQTNIMCLYETPFHTETSVDNHPKG